MSADDDWRLGGQERYLQGVALRRGAWHRPPSNPNWDHDHCSFCWATFMEADDPNAPPDALAEGYTTTVEHQHGDGYHWVCPACFSDFAERFEWRVVECDCGVSPM
jgi:hypothetical protein